MAAEQEAIIHVLISLAILLFAAKIFVEVYNKLRLPAVLGELIAGIIVGPFALGSIPVFDGKPLVILNETVLEIGQIAGIVILFIAGLAITPRVPEGRCSILYSRGMRYYCSVLSGLLCFYPIWITGFRIHSNSNSTYRNQRCNIS